MVKPIALAFALLSIVSVSAQLKRLTFDDTDQNSHFGKKVSIHGSTIVVAEPNYNRESTLVGRIHLYDIEDGDWLHRGQLSAIDLTSYASFGADVSMYGDDLVVGAPGDYRGAAFLYARTGGSWDSLQMLTIPAEVYKEGLYIRFGENVELSKDWLAISAPGYQGGDDHVRTGAVFLYRKEGNTWIYKQLLLPEETGRSTLFGRDIEFTDTRLLITAPKGDGGSVNSGVVFLYRLEGEIWVPDYTFINPSSRPHELFGADADIHANTIAIGAPMHTEDPATGPAGAVHVFQAFGDTWVRTALLEAEDGKRNDMFGANVVVEEGCISIASPRHDVDFHQDPGKVYVYHVHESFWSMSEAFIPPVSDLQPHMQFGSSLGLHGGRLVIGGHLMNNQLEDSGIAYCVELDEHVGREEVTRMDARVWMSPNPATNVLNVLPEGEWHPPISLTCYTTGGQPVLRDQYLPDAGGSFAMNIEKLVSGTYFLLVSDGRRQYIGKWIKL